MDLSNKSAPGLPGALFLFAYLAPLLSAEARLRAKADAGRGRAAKRSEVGRVRGTIRPNALRQPLTPTLSPQEQGEGEEEPPQFIFTSGQPLLSSGRKASSPGTVAISL